jgi:hypothetical protein
MAKAVLTDKYEFEHSWRQLADDVALKRFGVLDALSTSFSCAVRREMMDLWRPSTDGARHSGAGIAFNPHEGDLVMLTVDELVREIRTHRAYTHPIWDHWAARRPPPRSLAALFHQIQCFCASTRPGLAFPDGLDALGLDQQSKLIREIVASESGHGADLALMAGHLVNRSSPSVVFEEIDSQEKVEQGLKRYSDLLLGDKPGYDHATGLLPETAAAIAVFRRRNDASRTATWKNLGTALALEIISNRSLIPGEKRAIVDSGNYGVTLGDPEMHYLAEHWGEVGAEQHHEDNVVEAVTAALDVANAGLIREGVRDFLDSLAALWDTLDRLLIQPHTEKEAMSKQGLRQGADGAAANALAHARGI